MEALPRVPRKSAQHKEVDEDAEDEDEVLEEGGPPIFLKLALNEKAHGAVILERALSKMQHGPWMTNETKKKMNK